MTDPTPTPTRAEVEALVERLRSKTPNMTAGHNAMEEAADTLSALVAERDAAIQRAEAAEKECARLKNIRSAIAEGYNAEAVALEKSVSETLTAQLAAARRAEAAAWNDAIEAAAETMANGDLMEAPDHEPWFINRWLSVRALRRAAPAEGEA